MKIIIGIIMVLILSGCDNKDLTNYIAKSAYEDLKSKYNSLFDSYNDINKHNRDLQNQIYTLKQKNSILIKENRELRERINKYINGFKSMYE